jgi:polar amino acid transport system substrate-binding protein
MENRFTRRGLAGAAALVPAAALIGTAHAEGAESTYDRVMRTKTLRIAALPGEAPYFYKDIMTGTWSGACISMATDIAKVFDAKLAFVESTYGNSVLDLQSNKVDLAFALNPTPQRALSIGFTLPAIIQGFGCLAKKGFSPTKWSDIDKPDLNVTFDIGSLHDTMAHRFAAKAQLTGYKTRDDCILALQSGRADVDIIAVILGLSAVAKNPSLGPYHLLDEPSITLPSCMGVQRETDTKFVEVLNAWINFNRGIGNIRQWMVEGLQQSGAKIEDIPPQVSF